MLFQKVSIALQKTCVNDSTVESIISRCVHENKGRAALSKIFNAANERYIIRKLKESP